MSLTQDQQTLQKRLANNLHSAFNKGLENAPILSDLLGALAVAENGTDERTQRALLELLLDQAAGRWLDFWGFVFRVYPRKVEESDEAYRARIILETIRPRMSEIAIEDVLNEDPTQYAVVFTPLTKVVFASQRGTASEGWHCADGRYWHGCVIDVSVDNYNPLTDYFVNKNKAAGVLAWLSLRVRQSLQARSVASQSDGDCNFSAQTYMIRGNYRTEDITNENERIGAGLFSHNIQITEQVVEGMSWGDNWGGSWSNG